MSSSSKEKSGKKKKDVWQEAGGEFYQEQYPCGSGQAASTDNVNEATQRRVPRPHIPLPSLTARRNSFIPTGPRGRNKYNTRKQSLTATANATINATNCMTYTSTMAGGAANGNDVHVALMPDLADETIPNEKVTHEAIQKIRILTEPMGLKRLRKAKIAAIPKLRLHGWRMIKWELRKGYDSLKSFWVHRVMSITMFQNSLRKVEVRSGTSIVNVFLFIKWILFLNLAMSLAILVFIVLPYYFNHRHSLEDITSSTSCPVTFSDNSDDQDENFDIHYKTPEERQDCCTQLYHQDSRKGARGSLGLIMKLFFYQNTNNTKSIENNPFFYGYYTHDDASKGMEWFAFRYVMTFVGIIMVSMVLMVLSIGKGIQELIQAGEGEFYKYSNLIFAGWDHYTKDDRGASFKKKILLHEMKIALQTEKRNLESLVRSRKERLKLSLTRFFVNVTVIASIFLAGFSIFQISGMSIKHSTTKKPFDKTTIEGHVTSLAYSFAPSFLISFYNVIFPIILGKIGKYEKYSSEKETALLLIRALFIRLLSVGFAALKFYTVFYCEPEDNTPKAHGTLPKNYTCVKCDREDKTDDDLTFRSLCWESLFADQIYKLMIVDIILKVLLTFFVDPFRVKIKKTFSHAFCVKVGTINFNIVRHSLDMIYIQVLSWLGMYFGPLIPIAVVFYCLAVFYIKKYSVLYNCTAVPDTYKTIRTTTIYVVAKLISFIAVTLANAAVMGYMVPSRECGPFRRQLETEYRPWTPVVNIIRLRPSIYKVYEYIIAPQISTPIAIVLLLASYYYYSVAQANRALVDTLRHLLILEGHDKQYLFARLNSLRRPSTGSRSRGSTMLGTRN